MSAFREAEIITIPIRNLEVLVRIHGIPHDLTAEEASKIAAVVLAYGTPKREGGKQ